MTADGINSGRRFIHYNQDRTDYAVSEDEFELFQEAGSNLWKDVCLFLLGLGIPCLINAIHDTPDPLQLSISLLINYLVGGVALVLAFIFGIVWYRTSGRTKSIIKRIKDKPKHELPPSATNVGAIMIPTGSIRNE